MKCFGAILAAAVAGSAYAAIDGDLITSLPGLEGSTPTKQYSGYLDAGHGKHLHYMFVNSENDPANDPVVFWFNGGPGCSSLDGYWNENGPFEVSTDAAGQPKITDRQTRWNKIANTVYIEAPAGVGFSWAESASGYVFNDTTTADDNYNALASFFTGFPEFADNDVYISGESYAGVYVPTLAYTIMQNNGNGAPLQINLKGIMVGNGCTGTEVGSCAPTGTKISVDFLYGKGLFPEKLYTQLQANCGDYTDPDSTCNNLLNEMAYAVGPVDIYNIYSPCVNQGSQNLGRPLNKVEEAILSVAGDDDYPGPEPGPAGCISAGYATTYLNRADVRSALHVVNDTIVPEWNICTSKIDYTPSIANEPESIYPSLIKNYRVLVFNGDVDACVPYNGNEQWTSGMGYNYKEGTNGWRPWYVSNQVAGYVTEYENDFTFITIKGAGHMVPQYQPEFAYAFFSRFLDGRAF